MAKAVCVDPKQVHELWPAVSNSIYLAIKRGGGDNFEGTERDVLEGRSLLWLACDGSKIRGAAVTEFQHGGVCQIVAFSGRLCDVSLIETIEKFARDEGCSRVRMTGRKGWARVYRQYKQPYIVLERRL